MSKKDTYYAIGVMSGSSLDGLDLVYCKFVKTNTWSFEILAQYVQPLDDWLDKLKDLGKRSPKDIKFLDKKFGCFIGQSINQFRKNFTNKPIDIVVSHGHTAYHFPERGITKQIGLGSAIFQTTEFPTLSNLRQKDIEEGGQGAPIVPIGDLRLFPTYKYCLNIGGICNISTKKNHEIIAFDICSANQILNKIVETLKLKYDDKGSLAREGQFNQALFELLNTIPYYQQASPKSLDNSFSQVVLDIIKGFELSINDTLNTYCNHIAFQVSESIKKSTINREYMLITGGGAWNSFLVDKIEEYLVPKNIVPVLPSNEIIEYKEALVMAFMGVLYLRDEVNCLASVTGATKDTICGDYYFG